MKKQVAKDFNPEKLSLAERDKRCHQLVKLDMLWDEELNSYVGIRDYNRNVRVKYITILTKSRKEWKKLIETLKS